MVSTNELRTIKYILIVILSIGLYFTWLQKDKFEDLSARLQNKTIKLKERIKQLKLDLIYSKEIIPKDIKPIKIILPDTTVDYSQIIPEVNYKNLDLKLVDKPNKNDKIHLTPNVTLNKENKINSVEVQIETKF